MVAGSSLCTCILTQEVFLHLYRTDVRFDPAKGAASGPRSGRLASNQEKPSGRGIFLHGLEAVSAQQAPARFYFDLT